VQTADRVGVAAGSVAPVGAAGFAFVVATLNGAKTIAASVAACARQADTFVVSDGSTDDTVAVARAAGATTALQLESNVGKPGAIYELVRQLRLLDRYELICIVDDDTVVDDKFVGETRAAFRPGVAVVCAKTASDWNRSQRWNPIVATRAFAYWKYQTFIRRGQSALGVMNCISGSNSVYRSTFLRQVLRPDTPYVVDDTYWVLEAHRRKLGKVVYCPTTSALIQEPTRCGRGTSRTCAGCGVRARASSATRSDGERPASISPTSG
jgi:poly-beta-1,6-N-acetyl-D-glucosamine synthase